MDKPPSPLEFLYSFVLGNWWAVMSGAISIPITGLGLYVDNPTQKYLFLVLAVIAFIAAAYFLWAKERNRVCELQRKLTPKVKIEFDPSDEDGCVGATPHKEKYLDRGARPAP